MIKLYCKKGTFIFTSMQTNFNCTYQGAVFDLQRYDFFVYLHN